jgi:hypothetical protein
MHSRLLHLLFYSPHLTKIQSHPPNQHWKSKKAMNSEEQKQQIYKNWINRGRPWFDTDASKEPSYAEKQIILEILKRENDRIKTRPKNEVKALDRLLRNY